MSATADVIRSRLRKRDVPLEILGAMDASPVPVSVKHSTNELGVVELGDFWIVDGIAGDENVLRGCQYDSCQSEYEAEKLHDEQRMERWAAAGRVRGGEE